jgi:hypothetical protein
MPPTYKSGLPKLSRECLSSEIRCYGKYIVTVLLFGGMSIALALWIAYGR